MKTTKRLLALLLAFTLAFSLSVTALAADIGDATSGDASGTADVVYVDTVIYDFELPTDAALDFVLDPQGLHSMEEDDTLKLGEQEGGRIIPMDDAVTVINYSSVNAVLTATFTATSSSKATYLAFDTDDETTIAAVSAAEDDGTYAANVLIYAEVSAVDVPSLPDEDDEFVSAGRGFIFDDSDLDLVFIMDAADYEFTYDGSDYAVELVNEEVGHGTQFQLGGYVSTKADWKGIDDVAVNVAFEFTEYDADIYGDAEFDDAAYALVDESQDYLTVEAGTTAGGKAAVGFITSGTSAADYKTATTIATFTGSKGTLACEIPFYFGEENLSVSSAKLGTTALTFAKGTDCIKLTIGTAGSKGELTITLSDSTTYTITALTIT